MFKQIESFEIISHSSSFPNFKYDKSLEYTHNLWRSVYVCNLGSAVAHLIEARRYKPEGRRSLRFFNNLVFSAAIWSSNRKENEVHSEGKEGRCLWLTTFMCQLSSLFRILHNKELSLL
jgi:hypothetical protein